ncbi:MAG: phospho-sugar mutase [Clostridiales bacterium]|nr:phospho-sugar mutase [Clostridiales bacterium]
MPIQKADNAKLQYEKWLNSSKLDPESRAELLSIKDDPDEIKFRFLSNLEFGTGGLRGIMKAGTNCMNVYTVAHATQGFANLINKEKDAHRGVVIGYDSRNNSALFAKTVAEVLAANNIPVHLFNDIRPTPEVSFAIRRLGCLAGINITASHNPKEYNGYKAYWEDGAQLPPDHAHTVSDFIASIDIFEDVKRIDFNTAKKAGKVKIIGNEIDDAYIETLLLQRINPDAVPAVADELKIVYTPLHGAGYRLVPDLLHRTGLKHLYTVDEQMIPDGNFPTVEKPNPELPEVFKLGIEVARKVGSDLVIATDPDSDRIGTVSRRSDGDFAAISGNQMGVLLLEYILSTRKKRGELPDNAYAIKTIVTTELATEICRRHGIKQYNVLTGFKYIGEVIKKCEAEGNFGYVFGFEESYGYLSGSYARDKDGVCAAMLIVEMTAHYKSLGMTLWDALDNIYREYGYFMEGARDIYMEGLDGIKRRVEIMKNLRQNPPKFIGGNKVTAIGDYLAGTITDLESGISKPTNLPESDVLYYKLADGDVAVIRPSGTEPKIKMYFLVSAKSGDSAAEKVNRYLSMSDDLL